MKPGKLTPGMSILLGEMVGASGVAMVSRGSRNNARRNRMAALVKRGIAKHVERRADGDYFAMTDTGWLLVVERKRAANKAAGESVD